MEHLSYSNFQTKKDNNWNYWEKSNQALNVRKIRDLIKHLKLSTANGHSAKVIDNRENLSLGTYNLSPNVDSMLTNNSCSLLFFIDHIASMAMLPS